MALGSLEGIHILDAISFKEWQIEVLQDNQLGGDTVKRVGLVENPLRRLFAEATVASGRNNDDDLALTHCSRHDNSRYGQIRWPDEVSSSNRPIPRNML